MRYYLIALLILLSDQTTKWLVEHKMNLYESIPVIDGFFYLTSHRNRGAAFGILQDKIWLFVSITLIVIGFVVYYLWLVKDEKNPWMPTAFSLILGGAAGNLIDRIRLGEVVDFLHFQFGAYQFPIFNLADSSIVVGVFLLVVLTFASPAAEKEPLTKVRDTQ
ncbi:MULTISPECIES: signal peptidase II [Thermoactinomyces]|uniref:signal peptidase II n=1 Tax=Thermoactinomyces TaxID=2023 RepID=UPI00079FDDC4|nr:MULTISPECIES: signal peptidase II [Thermoactinomyces]KYQ86973.1 signal peptidase II [Thermoactinomyces sp. AS95]MBH8585593.1 signal peptidase II [Thermoactinomyces sp. CICC 10520]MBI0386910.1 signal peptidase II [Thermoactinomyces sp. CICC 24227]MBI0391683.1 signal peptidase II [Thermoactinomyces sp. CICC 24226]MCF6135117.1 signal peptidase II [Thermoactinomyces vulgaris]